MEFEFCVENATFGYAAEAGRPAISDAFAELIAGAPQEPKARESYLERNASAEVAQRLVLRAYVRTIAIVDVAQPFIGKRYSVDFVETANAADLLIVSDLLLALYLDPQLASTVSMQKVLAMVLPELFEPRGGESIELAATGKGRPMLAIADLKLRGLDAEAQACLAAWHDEVIREHSYGPAVEGVLADVAFVRELLFATYLDRDIKVDGDAITKPALQIGLLAVPIANALADRAAHRRRRTTLV